MSTLGLFAVGVVVTLIVAIGLALPIYGAILDGRFQAEHEDAELRTLFEKRSDHRSAA